MSSATLTSTTTTIMTMTTSKTPHEHSRRRPKSRDIDDPFLKLPITPPNGPSESQNASSSTPPTPHSQDSFLTKLLLTPLLMTSFLLSLLLTNFLSRRTRVHSSSTSTPVSIFAPSTWVIAEPYQNAAHQSHQNPDSTWDTKNPASEGSGRWYIRKKLRKVARVEIGDALEMHGAVMGALAGVMVVGMGVLLWVVYRSVGWVWR